METETERVKINQKKTKQTKIQETERRGCFGTFHNHQPAPALGKVG